VELTDIIASLGSAAAIVALMRVWQPTEPEPGRFAGPRPAIAGRCRAIGTPKRTEPGG